MASPAGDADAEDCLPLIAVRPACAGEFHVNALADNDANPGTSWELPLRTLDRAFELANGNEAADTISALAVDLYDADTDHNFTEILPARDLGARVLLASIDMGAFETGVVVDHDCPGDMNGDGCVDATDLALLLGAWGACPLGCQGDFDCSGRVGAADLAVLLGAFGQCCSLGEGGAGGQMMASASSSGGLLTPALAAELFGFDSIDAFAAWLGSLPTTERNALLFALFTESGGDL
jgi:hypothetical protein